MKTCGACKEEKDLSEFNKKGEGRWQSRCRACQKIWYDNYYRTSKKEKARLKQQRSDNTVLFREIIREAKSVPCMDCEQTYPYYVMDFDHREGVDKIYNIGRMGRRSKKALLAEIAKCDVVCANCHRERTHARALR